MPAVLPCSSCSSSGGLGSKLRPTSAAGTMLPALRPSRTSEPAFARALRMSPRGLANLVRTKARKSGFPPFRTTMSAALSAELASAKAALLGSAACWAAGVAGPPSVCSCSTVRFSSSGASLSKRLRWRMRAASKPRPPRQPQELWAQSTHQPRSRGTALPRKGRKSAGSVVKPAVRWLMPPRWELLKLGSDSSHMERFRKQASSSTRTSRP
mmetsp:Transcript_51327/g.164342  ORF Transcript_51327/g.164342 Transcript_51327/m.164342 type:complete len:212 (-) Transcript_51327:1468-2103(-)